VCETVRWKKGGEYERVVLGENVVDKFLRAGDAKGGENQKNSSRGGEELGSDKKQKKADRELLEDEKKKCDG